ncbi:MAG: Nif3-like dinuclear metal center hexameric protein [Planctomycetaceae bacterium]|nr:Nif3-like dinuclear metal center hexameric protein [Planctomycetaceae bacterium]
MLSLREVIAYLKEFAPLQLAEDWDNVGLLVGDERSTVERVMTCLTLTPDVADEAIARRIDLVVTHHPLLFRPVQRLTSDTPEGDLLLRLIRSGVAVYSPHTAFDSAAVGINQSLAESLGLTDIQGLRPHICEDDQDAVAQPAIGAGRQGRLPQAEPLRAFVERVKRALSISCLQFVGDELQSIAHVAVACGSAAEFLPDARRLSCDVLLTGEARFHACLEARTLGPAMVLAGHYATERPAVERLARHIAARFPGLDCGSSESERDPIEWSLP